LPRPSERGDDLCRISEPCLPSGLCEDAAHEAWDIALEVALDAAVPHGSNVAGTLAEKKRLADHLR
jgi:hypothetical protein